MIHQTQDAVKMLWDVDTTVGISGLRRKFSWGGFHSVAYGGHLYLVCGVCDVTIWCHIQVSKPTFSRNLL